MTNTTTPARVENWGGKTVRITEVRSTPVEAHEATNPYAVLLAAIAATLPDGVRYARQLAADTDVNREFRAAFHRAYTEATLLPATY